MIIPYFHSKREIQDEQQREHCSQVRPSQKIVELLSLDCEYFEHVCTKQSGGEDTCTGDKNFIATRAIENFSLSPANSPAEY